jgi:hypothetical protein
MIVMPAMKAGHPSRVAQSHRDGERAADDGERRGVEANAERE